MKAVEIDPHSPKPHAFLASFSFLRNQRGGEGKKRNETSLLWAVKPRSPRRPKDRQGSKRGKLLLHGFKKMQKTAGDG
jgi:hypothetical protein